MTILSSVGEEGFPRRPEKSGLLALGSDKCSRARIYRRSPAS